MERPTYEYIGVTNLAQELELRTEDILEYSRQGKFKLWVNWKELKRINCVINCIHTEEMMPISLSYLATKSRPKSLCEDCKHQIGGDECKYEDYPDEHHQKCEAFGLLDKCVPVPIQISDIYIKSQELGTVNTSSVSERGEATYLKIIGLLLEKHYHDEKYKQGDNNKNYNVSHIANSLSDFLQQKQYSEKGLSKETIRKKLASALDILKEMK